MQDVGLLSLVFCPVIQCLSQKPLSVTSLCMCVCVFVNMCVCMHVVYMCHIRGQPQETSLSFSETRFLSRTWCSPTKLGCLTNKPQGYLHLYSIGITSVCHHTCFVCLFVFMWVMGIEIRSSWLPNKYFANWVISPANFHICQWHLVYDELCPVSFINRSVPLHQCVLPGGLQPSHRISEPLLMETTCSNQDFSAHRLRA